MQLYIRPFCTMVSFGQTNHNPAGYNVPKRVDNRIHWMTQYSLHNLMDLGGTYQVETVIYQLDTTLHWMKHYDSITKAM